MSLLPLPFVRELPQEQNTKRPAVWSNYQSYESVMSYKSVINYQICFINIFCSTCKHWVYKKCSGITGMLKDNNQFKCKRCKTTETAENSNMEKVFLDGQAIEVVQRFCYLGR